MKYMIHTHIKRLWYVQKFLVPEMLEQGIDKNKIIIWLDDKNRGNLYSFLDSCKYIKLNEDLNDIIWHMQDDVVISNDFYLKTLEYVFNDGITCGFVSQKYNNAYKDKIGLTDLYHSWLSFLCIAIPNKYASEFYDWMLIHRNDENDFEYKKRYLANKHDDFFFIHFMRDKHADSFSYHLKPNIVNHIDYLIGGSINKPRYEIVDAYYWEDNGELEHLKNKLGLNNELNILMLGGDNNEEI